MPLTPGTRLGPYEIIAPLGAGGMGEVYKARDTRLNREVAIKALPDLFAQDAERVARITREAQTLAAMNHPNIAQIFGIESHSTSAGQAAGQSVALVMELVDGEDLSHHIARGPVPMGEALAIARQIADALEAAHEQGIVHRDLKPANVKIRPDGTVKVLDFGLAKAFDSAQAGASGGAGSAGGRGASPSNSPTLTAAGFGGAHGGPGTQIGMILGTASYMAPEQARGKVVDRRADIWAFGVVLFEMLTGRRVFAGEEISDVLAAVLRQDVDFTALPATTPASVRRLLKRCLERDPRKRLSAIGDARLDIDESDAPVQPAGAAVVRPSPPLIERLWPVLVGIAVTAGVAYAFWPSTPPASSAGHLARLSILPPPGKELVADSTSVALSPDGTMVAFVTGSQISSDKTELWVRSLDSKVARRLDEAVTDAVLPFWSPDSRRIGYSSTITSKLKTVAATGGRSDVIADAQTTRGAVWTRSNIILFALAEGPLKQVAATGGTPAPATILDADRKELSHRFPAMLPDGDHFLYVALPSRDGKFDVFVGSLRDTSLKTKISVGSLDSAPVYAPSTGSGRGESGYLLYGRQGVLAAVPFDAKELKITGDPILLEDEPAHVLDPAFSFTAGRSVTVSDDGSLAYYAAASTNTVASWLDASGTITGTLNLPPGHYDAVAISPDGKRGIAVRSSSAASSSLWLVDLARGTSTPFSTGAGRNDSPVWSPDGTRAVFASDRSGFQQFYTRNIDDAAPETEWYSSDIMFKMPFSFSSDRSLIVINTLRPKTMHDILAIDAAGQKPPAMLVNGPLRDVGGWVSPDDKWLAYASETGGSLEVWVQSFPTPGRRVQVSDKGGALAWWASGGRALIWMSSDFRSLWRADLVPGPTFNVRTPVKVATLPPGIMTMDAMPDRQHFLAIAPERSGAGSLMVVQNWRKALEGRK